MCCVDAISALVCSRSASVSESRPKPASPTAANPSIMDIERKRVRGVTVVGCDLV
jgi:hypothetical protein